MSDVQQNVSAELFVYDTRAVSDGIWEAVERNAASVLCQDWDEELLYSGVIAVRWVEATNAIALFREFVVPNGTMFPDQILRIDWEAWVTPSRFTGKFEEAIEHRVESVCVDLNTVLIQEVRTYGLGPEYNHIWWEADPRDVEATAEIPDEALTRLAELVSNDWWDDISEWVDEEFIEGLRPSFQYLVRQKLTEEAAGARDNV